MNKEEWENSSPQEMLNFLKVSERKLRLFTCACCRQVWPVLTEEEPRNSIEAAEQYADGAITEDELRKAWNRPIANDFLIFFCSGVDKCPPKTQAAILRDITDPFNRLTLYEEVPSRWGGHYVFGPEWLTWHDRLIPKLAREIYTERSFDKLEILADAVTEAGGPDELIAHLRSKGPHYRGCIALDALLNLE